MFKEKNISQEEWKQKIDQWQESGKSAASWCRDQKIIYSTFFYWRKRLNRDDSSLKLSSSSFIELADSTKKKKDITLECQGITIYLPTGFDGPTLLRLLNLLRGLLC